MIRKAENRGEPPARCPMVTDGPYVLINSFNERFHFQLCSTYSFNLCSFSGSDTILLLNTSFVLHWAWNSWKSLDLLATVDHRQYQAPCLTSLYDKKLIAERNLKLVRNHGNNGQSSSLQSSEAFLRCCPMRPASVGDESNG